jgi:hypothetical protein
MKRPIIARAAFLLRDMWEWVETITYRLRRTRYHSVYDLRGDGST